MFSLNKNHPAYIRYLQRKLGDTLDFGDFQVTEEDAKDLFEFLFDDQSHGPEYYTYPIYTQYEFDKQINK